ncbi:MAG: ABC transporter substrate-binding protein [Clostridiales bacterium]|nr:ABC transporter substrate-binding protein [Clostridiales bacterium]
MQKKVLAVALATTMGMSLAACGGSSSSSGSASTTAAAAAASETTAGESAAEASEATEDANVETIKIGFLTPMSGSNATYGLQVKAAGEMIRDVINEAHPELACALAEAAGLPNLNGAKIELVFADSKQDPTTAASEVKRLITEENVVLMTGQYTSAVTKAVAVVTETYGIPLLTAGSSPSLTDPDTGLEWYFRYCPNDDYFIEDAFKYLDYLNESQGADIKTVALVSEDTEFGANIRISEQTLAEQYGYEVVEDISYSSSATNVSSEVLRIKTADPDAIFMASYSSDAILYMKTFKEQNYLPKLILGQRGGFVQTDFLDTMGKDIEYICTTAGWSADIDTDASKQLVELYEQYTPDGTVLSEGCVKDMSNLLIGAIAINQAGSTEPEAIREALRNLDVDTSILPIPWTGITMNEYGQNTSGNSFIVQRIDGEYRTVYPTNAAAIETTVPMPGWDER